MTIQPIGAASVALYLTPADLREHGLTPEGLTLDRALELTREAFRQAGIPCSPTLEIEAYPDTCGVLVFARVCPPELVWYSFPGLEEILAAARRISPAPTGAALYAWQGRYWLSLPGKEHRAACLLSEFGALEEPGPHWQALLSEHGHPILPQDALGRLLTYFPV